MAKEDFCFTYYDGDAARDTTHMNRLERGAYHDIVISQRKFGHLTSAQITKILGRDFDECWPAIELIMIKDAEGKFFIEWLDRSILKMQAHSKKQSDNRKGKTKINQTGTKQEPTLNQTQPLEDGDGNEDGIELENKKESYENDSRETDTPRHLVWDDELYQETLDRLCKAYKVSGLQDHLDRWEGWYMNKFEWRKKDLQDMRKSFEAWLKDPKSQDKKTNGKHVTLAELQALRKGDV